jgi:SAM-dependent methyltransferase
MQPDFWDARFGADAAAFVYGTAPNAFLADAVPAHLDAPADVLDLGAGEGRNAVWLAAQGHRVTALDFSAEGLRKAEALAAERDVPLTTQQADVTAWAPSRTWHALAVTFLHLPPEHVSGLFRNVKAALRPGGLLFGEWFRPEQITDDYGSGGPPRLDMMLTPGLLRTHLRGGTFHRLAAATPTLDEGPHHRGPAATVRVVWQKDPRA